jgi:hypothetical protein
LRAGDGDPPCRKIYDAEDSFPTGSIRKTGRVFCRPDLVNVQKLDGILYDVKYLVIARNVTVRIIELNYSRIPEMLSLTGEFLSLFYK